MIVPPAEVKVMMQPLLNHQALVRPLFASPHLKLVIDAVIAGSSPGLLWVDDAAQPRTAALWDKTHALYLAGIAHNRSFNDALRQQVTETIAKTVDALKIYPASLDWYPVIETLYPYAVLHQPQRVFYRLAALKLPDWRQSIPPGFRISPINNHFTSLTPLQNFDRLHEEITSCWNALADFQQRGFGFCAHNDETIVGWCTAEYVSAGQCGIGIETVEAYQRQGFAALTASAFAEHALAHGITAHWDTWKQNSPSVTTAEKVGFTKVEDYTIYFGELKPTRTD